MADIGGYFKDMEGEASGSGTNAIKSTREELKTEADAEVEADTDKPGDSQDTPAVVPVAPNLASAMEVDNPTAPTMSGDSTAPSEDMSPDHRPMSVFAAPTDSTPFAAKREFDFVNAIFFFYL
jgi:hypothetical protein